MLCAGGDAILEPRETAFPRSFLVANDGHAVGAELCAQGVFYLKLCYADCVASIDLIEVGGKSVSFEGGCYDANLLLKVFLGTGVTFDGATLLLPHDADQLTPLGQSVLRSVSNPGHLLSQEAVDLSVSSTSALS